MEERAAPTQISTGSTAGDTTKQDLSAVSGANLDRTNGVPIFINRNYALLWVGRTISIGGDYVFNTSLGLYSGCCWTVLGSTSSKRCRPGGRTSSYPGEPHCRCVRRSVG